VLAALAAVGAAVLAWNIRQGVLPRARLVIRPERSVQGLAVGSPVRLMGAEVGQVVAIRLAPSPADGRLAPEAVLSVDLRRAPGLADPGACVDRGLRAILLPVNPASGFLEADLVWRPGSPAPRLTADEIPFAPRESLADVPSLVAAIDRLSRRDLRAESVALAAELDAAAGRLGDPDLAADLARAGVAADRAAEALGAAPGDALPPLRELSRRLRALAEDLRERVPDGAR
jgi:ABC-type transporter Mla subunit MlaD